MKALKDDYRGPFDPNLRYEDFSKEALIKLLVQYSSSYQMLLGAWYDVMRNKYGDKAAIECDIAQWMITGPMVARFVSKGLDIEGDDVEALFKRFQVDPGFPLGLFDIEWDLKNPNHGVFTVKKCRGLEFYEKEGKGFDYPLCHEVEPPTFTNTAHWTNPNIKVTPLKLPPRKSRDEIACQWEFKLEPSG